MTPAITDSIRPVILSGGSGTRLWPMSRSDCPKQLLALLPPDTLLQATARRVHESAFRPPYVVANARHAEDRKSVVSGQRVSVRVDLGGRRLNKKKKLPERRQRRCNKRDE